VIFAPIVKAFPNVRAVAESLETTAPEVFNVNVPVPSAES
jgi:hypothetical protein